MSARRYSSKGTAYSKSGKKVVSIDSLEEEMERILSDYSLDVEDTVSGVMVNVLENTVNQLKQTSPNKTGTRTYDASSGETKYHKANGKGPYARSWKYKFERNKYTNKVEGIVYSKAPYYRLTHLLEFGHAKVNGGRVNGTPHIEPAEKKAVSDFVNDVKEAIING